MGYVFEYSRINVGETMGKEIRGIRNEFVIDEPPGKSRITVCKEVGGAHFCKKMPRKAARQLVKAGHWRYRRIVPIPLPREVVEDILALK